MLGLNEHEWILVPDFGKIVLVNQPVSAPDIHARTSPASRQKAFRDSRTIKELKRIRVYAEGFGNFLSLRPLLIKNGLKSAER